MKETEEIDIFQRCRNCFGVQKFCESRCALTEMVLEPDSQSFWSQWLLTCEGRCVGWSMLGNDKVVQVLQEKKKRKSGNRRNIKGIGRESNARNEF